MKAKIVVLTAFLLCAFLVQLAEDSGAGVPNLLNYQGILKDSSGVPFDGMATMAFSIWDDSTGGFELWDEIHLSVAVNRGLFHILLGSSNPVPDSVFRQPTEG